MSDVEVYRNGLVHCSVCADASLTADQVAAAVNEENPSGTEFGWKISSEPTFSGGQSNPTQCENNAARLHWLMEC